MNKDQQEAWDSIRAQKQDYQLVFQRDAPAVQRVLQDLAKFCRATETVYHEDKRLTDVLIGRNEVWKRLQENLNLSSQDLYQLRTGQQLNFKEIENE